MGYCRILNGFFLWVTVFWLVSAIGCTPRVVNPIEPFVKQHQLKAPSATEFEICYKYGCKGRVTVVMSRSDWDTIGQVFHPPAKDAEEERVHLAKAVQMMEKIVGKKTGLDSDLAGSITGMFEEGQMDCVDEALNTLTLFRLFDQAGFVRHHTLAGIARRGYIFNGWPHVACAIQDTSDQQLYVLDSWFLAQGETVHVVPFQEWKNGWKPVGWHAI